MKTSFFPKTSLGRKSGYLFLMFILMIFAGRFISDMTNNAIEYPNPINSPIFGTFIYLTFFIAGFSFFAGLKAIFKMKERSILIYLATVICGYFAIGGLTLLIVGTVQSIL
ncbi:MAG: hypothetical protein NUK57_11655 [Gudongella sp.]|nr:hypothetical protein [Gudongella sp.]